MKKTYIYRYNKIVFKTIVDFDKETIDFSIFNPEKSEKPESLYKYYSISQNSVDALINHYLFAAHQKNLNDKYDCAPEIIDYSNFTLDSFIRFLSDEIQILNEEQIKTLYESDEKWQLYRLMEDMYHLKIYSRFGIISLTESVNDLLMWAYYSKNSGFTIKLKTSELPKNLFGPFPITYTPNLDKIDSSRNHPSICVLYQSNIKHNLWKNENEWRYLSYSKDNYHPFYAPSKINSRKLNYSTKAIEEIILGYNFFNEKEIMLKERKKEYDIINLSKKKNNVYMKKLKRKILNFIIDNDIYCTQIVRKKTEYKLDRAELKIEKISSNRFKIYNSFKTIL